MHTTLLVFISQSCFYRAGFKTDFVRGKEAKSDRSTYGRSRGKRRSGKLPYALEVSNHRLRDYSGRKKFHSVVAREIARSESSPQFFRHAQFQRLRHILIFANVFVSIILFRRAKSLKVNLMFIVSICIWYSSHEFLYSDAIIRISISKLSRFNKKSLV